MNNFTKDEVLDILAQCALSTKYGAKALFPDRFTRDFDPIYDQIFTLIDKRPGDPGYRPKKLVVAWRGFGKTSICGLTVPALAVLLQRYSYIVIIGYNSDDSEEKTEELKRELVNNEIVSKLYGDITTERWAKEEYIIRIGSKLIKIHPRGSGQPVRGRLFNNSRPGLVLVDDLEKSDEVDSEEQRAKKKKWFFNDVLNCIDMGLRHVPGQDPPWEILVMGTILHQDSLLMNLIHLDSWDKVVLELCDDNFVSNAPNFMDDAACRAKYEEYKEASEVDGWFREYRSNPVPTGDDAAFQGKFFQYYAETEQKLNSDPDVENIVIVDPSRTANPGSAPTGIVAVGVNMRSNAIFVRECSSKRIMPEEMYDEIARVLKMTHSRLLAVEVTGLHEFIVHPLKTFLRRKGISVEFMELQARKGIDERGKTARVRTLVDFYRQGLVWHNKAVCGELEQQLLAFPRAANWSLMDPLGYITEILEKGGRYMYAPGEFDADPDEIEAEYGELEEEYGGRQDWQRAVTPWYMG